MTTPLFQSFTRNTRGRDYAVGDIHGCFQALDEALAALAFDPNTDRVFSVGDLIDRGPQSEQFAQYLELPWFFAVRGNHDQMMLDAALDPAWNQNWQDNGGGWASAFTLAERTVWCDRLSTLPLAIEVATRDGPVGLVHANPMASTWAEVRDRLAPRSGQLPNLDDADRLLTGMLWSRTLVNHMEKAHREGIFMAPIPDLHALVMGHTVTEAPLHVANLWAIDTGACYRCATSALTLLNLQDLSLYQHPLPGPNRLQ